MENTIARHIDQTPGVCGGQPRIAGTRIRVIDIAVWYEKQGLSADEIVTNFPQLTLANVHAALAYYWDHRDEFERRLREADQLVETLKKAQLSPLQRKLARRGGDADPIPPG